MIPPINEQHLYRLALEKWGWELQSLMAMEEAGEFLQALSKYRRGKEEATSNLLEEIADLRIVLAQVEQIVLDERGLNEEYTGRVKREKLLRLAEMLIAPRTTIPPAYREEPRP